MTHNPHVEFPRCAKFKPEVIPLYDQRLEQQAFHAILTRNGGDVTEEEKNKALVHFAGEETGEFDDEGYAKRAGGNFTSVSMNTERGTREGNDHKHIVGKAL